MNYQYPPLDEEYEFQELVVKTELKVRLTSRYLHPVAEGPVVSNTAGFFVPWSDEVHNLMQLTH